MSLAGFDEKKLNADRYALRVADVRREALSQQCDAADDRVDSIRRAIHVSISNTIKAQIAKTVSALIDRAHADKPVAAAAAAVDVKEPATKRKTPHERKAELTEILTDSAKSYFGIDDRNPAPAKRVRVTAEEIHDKILATV